jgi:hypothetical protein
MRSRLGQSLLEYLLIVVSVMAILFAAVGKDGPVTQGVTNVMAHSQGAMEAGVQQSADAVGIKLKLD